MRESRHEYVNGNNPYDKRTDLVGGEEMKKRFIALFKALYIGMIFIPLIVFGGLFSQFGLDGSKVQILLCYIQGGLAVTLSIGYVALVVWAFLNPDRLG